MSLHTNPSILLLLGLLMACVTMIGAQSIGVCYGRNGNGLPPPSEVVTLYRQRNIGRMRIYDPDQQVLEALRDSGIEVMLGVPNDQLQGLASDPAAADRWVQTNVRNYPSVRFRYIAVGNEVTASGNSQYAPYLVNALRNVYDAVQKAGLSAQIKVSTAIETTVLGTNYPPSDAAFRGEILNSLLNSIIGFLRDTRQPLFVNIYTYFNYNPPSNLKLSYGLFTNSQPEFTDPNNNLQYQNLFDALLDALYSALEKASGSSLEIVVSESGWPSAGGTAATVDNARTYNQNLIQHVRGGTPKKPNRPIETYVFAMFNEDRKSGPDYEKNFGLFFPNKNPVYQINF